MARKLADYMTAPEAAAAAGIEPDTFTSYVSRGQAPASSARIVGRRVWLRADIEQWISNRPGRGRRTDLAGKR